MNSSIDDAPGFDNLADDVKAVLHMYHTRSAERRGEYERFLSGARGLPAQEKATAWLSYIAEHREGAKAKSA